MQGQVINGFVLKKLLGEGGMAEVWYAENEIGKAAAVKILNESLSHNEQIVERFHNEALVMVKLEHPNIRQVYGYGYIDNRHCIVMEYLEGEDLDALLKSGRKFTDEELQRWWNQTVDALNYTHAMGIVHRDIKPSNLFLDKNGNIKLLDFGIAKVKESMSMTRTGALMGTLMYMSPEQVRDTKNIDYRTDVYSLAVSFAQLVSGERPYDNEKSDDFEIREQIVYKPLDLKGLPPAWQGFLAPYLEKDPQMRPALRHFEAVMPKEEPAKTVVEPAPKPQPKKAEAQPIEKPQPKREEIITLPDESGEEPKSKKGLWIGLGVGAAALLLLLVLLLKLESKDEPQPIASNVEQVVENPVDEEMPVKEEAEVPVDSFMVDTFAVSQARQQAEAEEAAYKKCTTIAACDAYLKAYPNGKYAKQVKAKKAELENKEKKQSKEIQIKEDIVINAEVEQNEVIEEYVAPEVVEEVVVEEEIFQIVEEMPSFPGGEAKLNDYIAKNVKYPQIARETGIQGHVFVGFVIEPDGSISNVRLLRGIGGGCDEEAIRVVKSFPKWKPGKQRGKAVRVSYQLPVFFKLQ